MDVTNAPLDCLAAAAEDHRLISACVEEARAVVAAEFTQDAASAINALRRLLTKRLTAHFAFEEERAFPALLAASPGEPTASFLARLCEEHQGLLREAERLNEVLLCQNANQPISQTLQVALLDFLLKLERHSAEEDNYFIPILQRCRQATGRKPH